MMPKRRQKTRNRRLNDAAIEQLRAAIQSGYPWLHRPAREHVGGYFDLLALVKGCHFDFCDYWQEEDDEETPAFLWGELEAEIMEQHVRRRPGTRPACWWQFEAPEDPRVVGYERERAAATYNGEQVMTEVPEDEAEPIYETECAYLIRLDLFTPIEKEIFRKFDDIVFARVSSGMFGKCEQRWTEARRRAKWIDFELDAAVLPYDTFWLPADLIFDCEHREDWNREGIFTVDYWR